MPLADAPTQAELDRAAARRPDVGRRAGRIRRRRAGAVAGVVAVLVLAAAIPLALTRSSDHSEGVVTTVPPNPTSTTSPPPSTSTTVGVSTTNLPGTPFVYNSVRLVLPPGWIHQNFAGTCLAPPTASPTDGLSDCPGGLLLTTPDGIPSTPLEAVTSGHLWWDDGTGMDCPFGDSTGEKNMDSPEVAHGFRPVGNVTGEWEEWTATCAQGPVHHVQAWFLPQSNVLFLTASTSPEFAQILESVRPLPVSQDPLLAAVGRWGGRGTSLRINPDGVGVLTWRTYRHCSATVPYPCDSAMVPLSTYELTFTLDSAQAGPGGSWSGTGRIDGADDSSWVGRPVHVTEANGLVTITGGGLVAGTYPNGQLCSDNLRGAATNGGCP
jgi:hypothetical protein